jgi:WhiB family redox-sensing transcriptional regulator
MTRHAAPSQYIAPAYPDTRQAACRDEDAELFFPLGKGAWQAIAICERCPIRQACLDYALPQPGLIGVWGGMSEEDRKAERRRRFGARCPGCGRRGQGPCADTSACDEAHDKRMEDA